MDEIYKKAAGAARFIRQQIDNVGTVCIVTGSGLDAILSGYKVISRIQYSRIPHLNQTTFHRGEFLVLEHEGYRFCALNGRLHYYEGYTAREVGFPIRIMKLLGVQTMVMTNAAGGLNPDFNAGQIVMVRDHINLLPDNPLRGRNDDRLGPRFPDMSNAYDKELRTEIKSLAKANKIELEEGVYVSFQGPSLETPAEYLFLNRMGADLVGMSTVPEVITAVHSGIKVVVLSVVTNVCIPIENIKPTTVESVIAVAQKASPVLHKLIQLMLSKRLT